MRLPLVYHPAYSCPWPAAHRFPMGKFSDLYAHLRMSGIATAENMHTPAEPPAAWFTAVHKASYYDRFIGGALGAAQERRIGFGDEMRTQSLIDRTRLECAGTVLTAQLALRHGLAANLAGGTHHAHRDFGSGFTILNDLAVTASWVRTHTDVERVAAVDLDVHQGDGTAAIFAGDDHVFTFSMHAGSHPRARHTRPSSPPVRAAARARLARTVSTTCTRRTPNPPGTNFPFRKSTSDLDVDVPRGTGDEGYLALLRGALPGLLDDFRPGLVLYDAGVDVYAGDALGHLALSHAGIWKRDSFVIDECVRRGIPIACVIGGGYDRDRTALARRHALVHRAAARVWARRSLGDRDSRQLRGEGLEALPELPKAKRPSCTPGNDDLSTH